MELLRLFPTNLAIARIDDFESLNQELDQLTFLQGTSYITDVRKNVWDLKDQYPVLQKLYDKIMSAVVEYANNYYTDQHFQTDYFTVVNGWALENRRGDSLFVHNHRLNHLVCVYYWQVTEQTGAIDFVDPRGTLGFISLDKSTSFNIFKVQPKPGDLVIFPGWLLHYVHPNNTDTPRKVIGANIKLNDDVQFSTSGFVSRQAGTSTLKLN